MDLQSDPALAVAFNRAVHEHADSLKSFATRMIQDPVAAEDVAQDAFLALYRHVHEVPVAAWRPWLFRVVRNLCLDQLRRRKHRAALFRDLEGDDGQFVLPDPRVCDGPEHMARQREAMEAVEQAIEALPPKFREVFLLCEMQGVSYEEAATILSIPVKTVSTRLFRARVRFRNTIQKTLGILP